MSPWKKYIVFNHPSSLNNKWLVIVPDPENRHFVYVNVNMVACHAKVLVNVDEMRCGL